MNFYFFNAHMNDVDELYNNHFYGGLFIYDVPKGDSFTKVARVIDSDKEFKYLVAVRPYTISPQLVTMIYNSINDIHPGRLQLNIVSGSGEIQQLIKQSRDEYIAGTKKDFGGILGNITDKSPPIERSNYLIDFINMLNSLDTNIPDFFVSTTNNYVFDAAVKNNNKTIIPYAMYRNNTFDIKGKEVMISIKPILRKTQEELNALPKPEGIWNKYTGQYDHKDYDYFTYDEFAEVINKLKKENIKNVLLAGCRIEQIYNPPIEERKNILSFVKQYKEGLLKG